MVDNKVYILRYNSDSTEGRGPMVIHSVWGNRDECIKFMDKQSGVQGRKQKWSEPHSGGDWDMIEHTLLWEEKDVTEMENIQTRERALAKLSDEEKKVLGLSSLGGTGRRV